MLSPSQLRSSVTVSQRNVSWWRSPCYCSLSKWANQSKNFNKCLNYIAGLLVETVRETFLLWKLSCYGHCSGRGWAFQASAKPSIKRKSKFCKCNCFVISRYWLNPKGKISNSFLWKGCFVYRTDVWNSVVRTFLKDAFKIPSIQISAQILESQMICLLISNMEEIHSQFSMVPVGFFGYKCCIECSLCAENCTFFFLHMCTWVKYSKNVMPIGTNA